MASYKLSENARDDLIRIHQYGVRQFGVERADQYFANFFEKFDLIAANPRLFAEANDIRECYRRCPCGSDTIYYRITNEVVEIMAIIRQQDTQVWL